MRIFHLLPRSSKVIQLLALSVWLRPLLILMGIFIYLVDNTTKHWRTATPSGSFEVVVAAFLLSIRPYPLVWVPLFLPVVRFRVPLATFQLSIPRFVHLMEHGLQLEIVLLVWHVRFLSKYRMQWGVLVPVFYKAVFVLLLVSGFAVSGLNAATCQPNGNWSVAGNCSDINECSNASACVGVATCSNTIGSYLCHCPSGFFYNYTTPSCLDIDECLNSTNCRGSVGCSNTIGSYACICPGGYNYNFSTSVCQDINECLNATTCTGATCLNTIGSYACQ